MTIVALRGVSKTFAPPTRREAPIPALDDVSLEIEAGEIFGIIGYSGAGKSTLVRLINGLEQASSGSVVVAGRELTGLAERELRRVRGGIGMIFQQFNLWNSKTVWANIEFPLLVARTPEAERNRRISELLHFVGLADKAAAFPDQLSGGQKQRVGIARALATNPSILLADEATSALDPETTQEVLALLRRVNEEFGTTIVVITHEMEVVKSLAHRVAVMELGRVIELGEVFDVFSQPRTEAAQRFVATVVRAVPVAEELALLRAKHQGRIVTLSFSDADAAQSSVLVELGRRGVIFELVSGGIDEVRGRSFGHLTLALRGEPAAIDAALQTIGERVSVTEAP